MFNPKIKEASETSNIVTDVSIDREVYLICGAMGYCMKSDSVLN